jgi:tetratricopeptide (TPR) repeat protein
MKSVSRLALGAALAIGATGVLFPAPADAQRAPRPGQQQARPAQVQAQGRTLNLNAQERAALVALEAAVRGTDRAAQDAALTAARGVVRGPDARYAFHGFQYNIARTRGDNQMALEAIEGLLASGQVPAAEQPGYLEAQYQLAVGTQQWPVAERAARRLLELRPNDADLLGNLASIRMQQGAREEGMQFLQRAIAAKQAAGQPIPANWLRFALRDAYDSRVPAVRARSAGIARQLVTAAPTPENWRDALAILRETGQYDAGAQLDIWRLALQAGALGGERDYYDFANALNQGGYPAEAKAVLETGISRRMVNASRPEFRDLLALASGRVPADRADLPASQRTALAAATGTPALRTGDAFLGHGRYTDAIALYQAALQKGGVDANVVNTRLGIAYALAGQRAQAEAAFRLVTGPRAEIAQFWLTWLAQRPAS